MKKPTKQMIRVAKEARTYAMDSYMAGLYSDEREEPRFVQMAKQLGDRAYNDSLKLQNAQRMDQANKNLSRR